MCHNLACLFLHLLRCEDGYIADTASLLLCACFRALNMNKNPAQVSEARDSNLVTLISLQTLTLLSVRSWTEYSGTDPDQGGTFLNSNSKITRHAHG